MREYQHLTEREFENFDLIEHPVWVFDPSSLQIRAANDRACEWLDYDRDTLKSRTIADLRPPEERAAIFAEVERFPAGTNRHSAGSWHVLKASGQPRKASFEWRRIKFAGQSAILATINDITEQAGTEASNATLASQVAELEQRGPQELENYQALFAVLPGKFLILAPETFEIVAVSNDYLKATSSTREQLIGSPVFEAFPEDLQDKNPSGVRSLHHSLHRVARFKTADSVPVQRYPVRRPDGSVEQRYWSQLNVPVLDEHDKLFFLVHRAEDLTPLYAGDEAIMDFAAAQNNALFQDMRLSPEQVRAALYKAEEQNIRLGTAESLLQLGAWEMDLDTLSLNWSPMVFEMYGIPEGSDIDLETYMNMVHPEDEPATRQAYREFVDKKDQEQLLFSHRIVTVDGEIRHVRGVGQRYQSPSGEILVGYVADISPFIDMQKDFLSTQELLRIAGEKIRLGGWKVELDPEKLVWTPETAAIHGEPADVSLAVEDAINYYAPEFRDQISKAFYACATQGKDLDEILQIITAQGDRLWVRSIGTAIRNSEDKIIAVQGAFQDITPLMEARSRVGDLERQRLEILDAMSDAFFTLDRHWRFTYLNKQAEIDIGTDRSALLGKSVWEEFPDARDTQFAQAYRTAVETGEVQRFVEHFPPRDSWFQVSAHPMRDGSGGLAVYFRDISAERSNQLRLQLLESAVENLNDIILITEGDAINEPEGPRIVYTNKAFEKITGYSESEAVGRTPRFLQGKNTDRAELDRIRVALESRQPVRAELINYDKQGREFWLDIRITPLLDSHGKAINFVAIERDVSVLKRADAKRKSSEERFRLIAKATSDVIRDWDLGSGEIWWSKSLFAVFGYSSETLERGPEAWSNRIAGKDRARVLTSLQEAIAGGELEWECEYQFVNADGKAATVYDRGFIVRDESGKAQRMLVSMTDLTRERALEAQARESQKLEAIGQLTGGVAHDFNYLLTVILGSAEELQERLHGVEEKELAEMVVSASERAAELTNLLLAFSRRQVLRPQRIDINEQLATMQRLFKRTLGEDIDFLIKKGKNLKLVEIDQGQLEVALLNLVINARHAMPGGGHLTIETGNASLDKTYAENNDISPGDYVFITVTDDGCGMDAHTATHAFEPFFTTKEAGQGSGLGLSMVYGFAKQSQGHVKIYSEPGEGTAMKLYFPVANPGLTSHADDREDEKEERGSEHILVVEDDELVRKHLVSTLSFLGYQVSQAEHGEDALRLLTETADIDMLLTDVVLPGGMGGRETAEAARTLQPDIKVLYTSGYPQSAIMHNGRLDEGVELLSKPYRRREVARLVRKVLEG